MRTIETTAYTFDELSDKAKGKALDYFRQTIDYEFEYECLQNDAKSVGLSLEGWDYGRYAKVSFIDSPADVATSILKDHGETCGTVASAKAFFSEYDNGLREVLPVDDEDAADTYQESEHYDEACSEFLRALSEDYRILMDNSADYASSDEAIIELIECNEYEFTEDGKLI